MQSFYLPDIGPSSNVFYSGIHWSKRKQIADYWHHLVFIWAKKHDVRPVVVPVTLHFALSFGPARKAYDASNCSATAKLIEDGLVKAKILRGDGPRYVAWIKLRPLPRQPETFTLVRIDEEL